ncbi:MAG TPA: hypothetical protein VJI46_05160 [Candidatus Nanoarchaeia archaeon]|nr:hypothetical protein [Candidatus Nanoarchaeia archaeon]
MPEDFSNFKENVDAWIKQVRHEVTEVKSYSRAVEENSCNIQHNYELVHDLRRELQELRQEMNALKLLHVMSIRRGLMKKMN